MAKKRPRLKNGTNPKAKPKSEVTLPATTWDQGPDTPLQRSLKITEDVGRINPISGKMENPNEVRRTRRLSVAEYYQRNGILSQREAEAARKLLNAWERNQRRPPAIKEINVDSSPKPDHFIAVTIDRISAYRAIAKHVPRKYQAYVMQVGRDNHYLEAMPGFRDAYFDRLKIGLEQLADNLGI